MAAVCARAGAEGLRGIAFGDLFLEDIRAYRIARLPGTGLEPIFPVWCPSLGLSTTELAHQMLAAGLRAHLTCIDPRLAGPLLHAGRTFDAASWLADLPPSVDPCGERGEFHTFAFAGPVFSRTIPVIPGDRVERDNFIYADLLPAPGPQQPSGPGSALMSPEPPRNFAAQLRARGCCSLVCASFFCCWLWPRSRQPLQPRSSPTPAGRAPASPPSPGTSVPSSTRSATLVRTSRPSPIASTPCSPPASMPSSCAPPAPAARSAAANAEQAIAAQAVLDSFDNFTRQATARGIRVLAALPAAHAGSDLAGRARFWLTRGVAGLRLGKSPHDASAQDRAAITPPPSRSPVSPRAGAMGQRIVISDLPRAMTENSDSSIVCDADPACATPRPQHAAAVAGHPAPLPRSFTGHDALPANSPHPARLRCARSSLPQALATP